MGESSLSLQLAAHLRALGGPRDPFLSAGAHHLAQAYIRSQLGQWGEVSAQPFEVRGRSHFNWQLKLPGKAPDLAPVLVGAHYDTVPGSPGADDNGSGVAVLLVLAALLAQAKPRRPLYLVAFDLEEYGLVGSLTCAQSMRSQQMPLHLMLSLEMLGYFTQVRGSQRYPLPLLGRLYPDTGNFLALIGNGAALPQMVGLQRYLSRAQVPAYWLPVLHQGRQLPATRRSDHAPFWDVGYRAILVTDTADLRNPHYHSPSDRIETLNLTLMANITRGLANFLTLL